MDIRNQYVVSSPISGLMDLSAPQSTINTDHYLSSPIPGLMVSPDVTGPQWYYAPLAYTDSQMPYDRDFHIGKGARKQALRMPNNTMQPHEERSRCAPWSDVGWTVASKVNARPSLYCVYFARGCCNRGSACKSHHHVPHCQVDSGNLDVFGRLRLDTDDKDERCLFLATLQFEESQHMHLWNELLNIFSPWGPLESIIVGNGRAWVKYEYRSAAEFAKAACSGQQMSFSPSLEIRWAFRY